MIAPERFLNNETSLLSDRSIVVFEYGLQTNSNSII